MTDRVIKALECISGKEVYCEDCSYSALYRYNFCIKRCAKDAIDLINRQKAEIERLQAMANAELDTIHKLGDDYERVLEEEQELVKLAKAEAIKEFAERLKKAKQYSYERHENIVPVAVIDWIVEEMVGDIPKIEHNSLCETETYRMGE